jgi:hypothetical protein
VRWTPVPKQNTESRFPRPGCCLGDMALLAIFAVMGTSPDGRRAVTLSDFHPQQAMDDSRCVVFIAAILHLLSLDHLNPILKDIGLVISGILASTTSRYIKRRISLPPTTGNVRLPNPGAIPDWFWAFCTRWRVGWFEHRVQVAKANLRWEKVRARIPQASKSGRRSLNGPFVVQAEKSESG